MGYSLNIVQNSVTYDVSDYVSDLSSFPYYARNETYVPINDDMDFKLSKNYLDINPTIIFDIGSQILIYSASVLVFNGDITETSYNQKSFEYEFVVEQRLQKLKQYLISVEDMYTEVSASSTGYTIYDYHTEAGFITIDELLDTMFAKIGMSLDFSERAVESIVSVPYISSSLRDYEGDEIASWVNLSKAFVPGDLLIYKEQLFCINQEKVYTPFQIQYDPQNENLGLREKRVSLYDLLEKLNVVTGYNFIPKDDTTFYVVNNRSFPDRSVNFDMEFNSFTKIPETNGVKINYVIPLNPEAPIFAFQNFGYYNFIPWQPFETPDWYVGGSGVDFVADKAVSYFNIIQGEAAEIEWFNHLIFWELPNVGGSNHAANIIMPTLWGADGLFVRPIQSKMWDSFTQEYDNLINTERVATTENYITIDRNDGKNTKSSIKTVVFTNTTPEGAG